MELASPVPWWLALAAGAVLVALAWLVYRRPPIALSRPARITLTALRATALLLIAFLLLRPVRLLPPAANGDLIFPVLVDVSRSMRIADAAGAPRLSRALSLVRDAVIPALTTTGRVEVLGVSDRLLPLASAEAAADGVASDLSGAIDLARERYRGQRVGAFILVSDGGNTGVPPAASPKNEAPVVAIGVGSVAGLPDREILGITAGDPKLDQATVDLHVSAVAHGFARQPLTLKLSANGQVLETRQITPAADGSPIGEAFTVSPDPQRATVYTAEVQGETADAVPENDRRSVLVSPVGRPRRILFLAGAPGYDHSFLARALTEDPGLELDVVVRKGKNEAGIDTFMVQAGGGRAGTLTTGFPATREALFAYDAIVIANIEADFFSRAQLDMATAFVSERGGGLLVFGGRSFERRGLIGSSLEEALPLELNDRRAPGTRPAANGEEAGGPLDTLALTRDGETHPMMRLGATAEESRKLWASLPPLSSLAPVGGARPGATVLAVSRGENGITPVVAVQRYGRGRSMIFGGEASWRWRMMLPSDDRRYETFWRQALRWLSVAAPEPITIDGGSTMARGQPIAMIAEVRDKNYQPLPDATLDARLVDTSNASTPIAVRPLGGGRFALTATANDAGALRVRVEARRAGVPAGEAERWIYVGGADPEFAEPRLNEPFLRRLASGTGGRYVAAANAGTALDDLRRAMPPNLEPVRQDLWNRPWVFVIIILVLATEWLLRRRWGLR